MEQVPAARGSKYSCYFYQTFAGFCNTTLSSTLEVNAVLSLGNDHQTDVERKHT